MQQTTPRDIDNCLKAVPGEARATLGELRKTIKAAAPKADEVISYQIPTYKYHGPLVAFAALKNHCGFFVMCPSVMEAYKHALEAYDTSTSTIRFPADKPLPAALIKTLIKAGIEENEARRKKGQNKKE